MNDFVVMAPVKARSFPALAGRSRLTTRAIGLAALRSLYQELLCCPKPGLVSFVDNGSHCDMDPKTFIRSLISLRHYFFEIADAGHAGAPFALLKTLGLAAEQQMLAATGGVNTHRGAIFNLGLLAAAAGWLLAQGWSTAGAALGDTIRNRWGRTLLNHVSDASSHGSSMALRYGAGGARVEAARGFPTVFYCGLPVLEESLGNFGDLNRAGVETFFSLMAVVEDTNLLYRGGAQGLAFAKAAAADFLESGGVKQYDWHDHALSIHRDFIARNLSPGGSADLLAATLFVHHLQQG